MMLWLFELRLFLRERAAVPALGLLALLSAASVWAGMAQVAQQRDVIARIQPQQAADVAAVANGMAFGKDTDAGSAAYYTFHTTWDAPSALAFAAIGQRDVAPYVLRVRALGLEAQLYEGETYNPELALPGRFDFAFVLTYLLPLFAIILFHDLRSGEREAGRLMTLSAMARHERLLWLRRRLVRAVLIFGAIVLPFVIGAIMSGVTVTLIAAVLGLAAAYLAFWIIVAAAIGRMGWSSVTNAGALAASWLVLTLVLPALAHIAINNAVPVSQGVELTLAHREKVHGAWEVPREETMAAFYRSYPEWAKSAPLPKGFHYKWYFAFHQLGDESVAPAAKAYRDGLLARDALTTKTGWVLPAIGVQSVLHRLAKTDLKAGLAYQTRIRAYHAQLRAFYYRYLFTDTPFGNGDFAKAPKFSRR
jgi:ABC-2 type transport system permease protein